MKSTLHQRRVEQEWRLLELLARANEQSIEDVRRREGASGETFELTLLKTRAIIETCGNREVVDKHSVAFHFRTLFPSIPIEANLSRPVFHPNVHPHNGFVCLWNRFSSGDTIIEAVVQLQRILTFQLVNDLADHVMQPKCLDWYNDPERGLELPLWCDPIRKPQDLEAERTYARRPVGTFRRRLE
jgi:hypothetical protein